MACALLVTTHRSATVRCADRVVLLRDGSVATEGTPDELLAVGSVWGGAR